MTGAHKSSVVSSRPLFKVNVAESDQRDQWARPVPNWVRYSCVGAVVR